MMYNRRNFCQFLLVLFCVFLFLLVMQQYCGTKLTLKEESNITQAYPKIIINCKDIPKKISIEERGNYMVYYNIVPATKYFRCHESITLTTMTEYNFLGNLMPLTERWRGPISVAVYAPGDDFKAALDAIAYYTYCKMKSIKDLVSFHLFHDKDHYPKVDASVISLLRNHPAVTGNLVYCKRLRPPTNQETYRNRNNLPFPVNVARNIARLPAETHYIFASDIELYPSLYIIPNFLKRLENDPKLKTTQRTVFAVAVFEIKSEFREPNTKNQLLKMYQNKTAFLFHERFCKVCHGIPREEEWLQTHAPEDGTLTSFATVKRLNKYKHWEPLYIGTQKEPLYDERIFWEGGSDKMVQGYALCLLDYDFILLDNAFLAHKSGIKLKSSQNQIARNMTRKTMVEHIEPEMNTLYGKRDGCTMYI